MIKKEDAQLYTVEAITAGILMLLVVIFIVKGAPLSSNTSSSSNKDVEGQLEILGQDLLTILDYSSNDSSPLKQALVEWDVGNGQTYKGQQSELPTSLNFTYQALQEALWNDGIANNLEVSFNNSGGIENSQIFWNGEPSDNAVTVSKKIILHDDDARVLLGQDWPDKPISNLDGNKTNFYNTATVRLTLWRI